VTEHPGEQFPPDVDPDVEPGFEPHPSEETPEQPDYDTEPDPDFAYDEAEPETDAEAAFEASLEEPASDEEPAAEHVDPAEVEFGPEFARAPGQEHEHRFAAESAVPQHSEDSAVPQESAEDDPAGDEEAGHPLVEETMARLDELRDRPVGEHAEVYADLHERLQSALVEADADHGDRG
jgi:hypothetical protein